MAYGVGLISNLRGQMEDILTREGCGFSFDADDVDGLAALIERLLKDRLAVDNARAGAARFFMEHCDADRIYPELVTFLGDVAAPA